MRKITSLLAVVALLGLIQVVFPNAAFGLFGLFTDSAQVSASDIVPLVPKSADKNKPGFPHVNYDDPAAAVREDGNSAAVSSAALAATADFDSDGVVDLITTGVDGRLLFYKGNSDTIYPNSPEAKQRRAAFGEVAPFFAPLPMAELGFSPDYLESGDFNGDGFSDLLIAAKGSSQLTVLRGNGGGNFVAQQAVRIDGSITALAIGEIGRKDQQADVAVAYQNRNGAFIAIFEHPEGAFARKPEIFVQPFAAQSIAIGNLDKDPYGDVAAAGGNKLTLVHGRGQAYPLDMKADLDIQRPAAFVQTRQMPFAIADVAIGLFGNERGESIALLSTDGRITLLEPRRSGVVINTNKLTTDEMQRTSVPAMRPADAEPRNFGMIKNDPPKTEAEADERGQIMADATAIKEDRERVFSDKFAALQQALAKQTASEQSAIISARVQTTIETTARRKAAFEANLTPKPVPFSKFRVETIAADPAIANAISAGRPHQMIKGRFSDSGLDDIAMLDRVTGHLNVVGRWNVEGQPNRQASVVSFGVAQDAVSVVPMRLNADALSDLVMIGAGSPSVMMSLPAATFTVNSADADSGGDCVTPNTVCTLRRALFLANTNIGGTNLIVFDIPGSGVHTLHPSSNFPDVNKQTTIDGTTQPGFAGTPLIEISGDLMTGSHEGLKIKASNSLVRGLAINLIPSNDDGNGSQIGGSGITVLSTSSFQNVGNVIIEGNFLGTDPTGEIKKGNDANGVHIFDADNNTIGGTTPQARNILSGNGNPDANRVGVGLAITGGNNNFIYGNYIGTNLLGNIKVGNSYGVFFTGINNQFGGDAFGEGNVVSGNGGPPNSFGQCGGGGIGLSGLINLADGSVATDANNLKGNKIGTSANGLSPLGNCGVGVSSPSDINTRIGSITQNGRNTISDNGWDALYCAYRGTYELSGACYIIGNNIGTDITGSVAMRNDQRNNSCSGFCLVTDTVWVSPTDLAFVIVGSPGGTSPGGDCSGFCNLISGNLDSGGFGGGGLYRSGFGFVLAVNNYIGVNRSGTAALPNFSGFNSYFGSFAFGVEFSDGSGGSIAGGNVSSGNDQNGVSTTAIYGGGTFEIRGNLIGLSSDGNSPIGNGVGGTGSSGISVQSIAGTSTFVGGTTDLQRNYIAAQTSDPIFNGTRGTGLSINTANGALTTVFNNWIGLNKSGNLTGNSGNGIAVSGDGRTRIGGLQPDESNLIIGNGRAGVVVSQFTGPFGSSPAKNVTIRRNGIAINGGLGIDLVNATQSDPHPSGVTINDCFDSDDGANGYQNFPELFAPVINGNGTVSIPTTLRSVPASQFTIDYYQSPAADPSTYGEGSNYIGSVNVQTDGNGFAGFTFTSANPVIPTQLSFTATATDLFGNTSEFSCSAGVCTTGTFQEALESPEATCIEPIIVNINSNESDPNTADGFCDVDTNNTGLQCSLRAAIQEANARNGFDIINFDIPGAGVHTISIPAALKLPHITERVMINGTTQPGYNGTPLIEVSGIIEDDQLPGQGFVIDTSRVEISGLAINRFAGNIFIGGAGFTTNDNFIYGCFIGMHPDGTVDTIAGQYGIAVGGSSKNNKIGAQYFEPNVVANTVIGIQLAGSGVQNNQIANNKIGTDRAGTSAKANYGGILIGSNAKNNLIGGELEGEGNVISGNALNGVSIGTNAEANKISGNLIGTDVTGNFVIRNGMEGIKLTSGAKLNIIGGPASQRNIISGNGGGVDPARGFQILIEATAIQNEIYGNYIGLKKDGSEGLGGITGIGCAGNNNKIGGYQTMPNVIASQQVGIALGSGDPGLINSNQVSYNRIGTNPAGTSSSANTFGILAIGQVVNTSINHNLISGNQAAGILLRDGVTSTTISENRIGTDINGNLAINSLVGIAVIKSSSNNIINNQISGNSAVGLLFGDDLVQPPANINEIVKQFAPAESPNGTPQYTDLNVVEGNRIGTDAVGTNPIPNGIGIIVGQNARDNQIGGKRSEGKGNVISGHTLQAGSAGIILGPIVNTTSDQFPQGNKVQGNRIGIRALSFQPLPNNIGIVFNGAGTNIIGAEDISCPDPNVPCDASDFGNIIGGNISDGVREENSGSTANLIKRNFIGVAPDGTAIPNGGNGVAIYNPQDVTVTENTICNSGGNGILVQGNAPARDEIGRPPVKRELGGFLTKISGNIIGLKILNGISKAPNALAGIKLSNINGVLVGNNQQGASKNLISGNDGPGVLIEGYNSYSNQINNSIIGTDSEGTLDLGNGGDGVKLVNASANVIGDNVGAGGRDATISGNTGNGVSIEGQGAVYNSVLSNAIGVIRTNNNAFLRVANQQNGVVIQNAANNAIGGVFGQVGNKISGNLRSGILIIGSNSINNLVKRNLIGIDQIGTAFGNTMHGIHLTQGASNNIVGGDETDAGNTIGGNGGNGIFIEDGQPPPRTEGTQSTQNNRFTRNNIFGNSGLGIDIFPAGANPNDGGDGDGGPNRGQNYPEIETYYIDGNGDLIVFYLLDTDPANANYGVNGIKIEFFISDAAGQGRFPIASNQFWTVSDYNNTGSKQINLGNAAQLGFQLGDSLTAAATDADGNTSEFVATGFVPSPTPTASSTPTPDPVISGTITYGNAIGSPAQRFVSNALVHAAGSTISMTTATGANGEYSLSGFDSGAYTITPSKTGGQNNAISSFDAALISQHVLGAPLPSLIGNQLVVADVSGNGTISSFDAAQIARYVVSLPPTGSTGNWKFNPASNSYPSITSSITGEDYSALLMGEVSGDWDSVGSRRSAVGSDIVVDMPEMTVSENSELIIPVGVKGIADKGIISYEFNLKYDPFVIRPQADPIDLAGTTSRNLTAVFNAETPGLLRVAVYGPMPITGDGVLLNLRFTSVGQSGTTSKLIWQRMIFNEGLSAATKDGLVQIF